MKGILKESLEQVKKVPSLLFTLYCVCLILMNLCATKPLVNNDYIAIDCGLIASWLPFMIMDIVTRIYGSRTSIFISFVALAVNFFACFILLLVALVPYEWALNDYGTFVGWWVISVSTLATMCGAIVNSVLHEKIYLSKKDKKSFLSFLSGSLPSTLIAQFVDNIIFCFFFTYIASSIGIWGMQKLTVLALINFALIQTLFELIIEFITSPFAYKVEQVIKNKKYVF